MTDNSNNNINTHNTDLINPLDNKYVGKRKCELPIENKFDKMKKTSNRQEKTKESLKFFNIPNPDVEVIEINIKPKIEKLAVNSNRSESVNNSKSNSGINNFNKTKENISKTKFSEGLTKTLSSNLNKILNRERMLDNNIDNLTNSTDDANIKILNEMVKKNLNLYELEKLKNQLEEMRIFNEEKRKNVNDTTAQMMGNRETWTINLDKTNFTIDHINKVQMKLEAARQTREEEILLESRNHEILSLKEKDVGNLKTTISFDILKIDEDIKIVERKQKLTNIELEKVKSKKDENYKNKFEAMSQLLVLKPFYKKFGVIRNYKQNNNNNNFAFISNSNEINVLNNINPIKIDKTRKILHILENNEECKIKFDYISSLFDHPCEEVNHCKESTLLNEECVSLLMSYLIKMNQFNDERDFLVLYLTEKIALVNTDEKHEMDFFNLISNQNLLIIIQELINRISHYNEYSVFMKVGYNEEFHDIIKETHFNNNIKFTFSSKDIQKNLEKIYHKVTGSKNIKICSIYFCIKNLKNNSKLKIFNMDYNNSTVVGNLLVKFNEMNMPKKKKDRSSKKGKKSFKEILYLLDEMEFNSGYFFSTILDVPVEEFNHSENIKEILLNI